MSTKHFFRKLIGDVLANFIKSKLHTLQSVLSIKSVKFSVKTIAAGHHHITYRSIPCVKCPFDYVLYQMIVIGLRPDLIIEIGTNVGGSTLYLADLLDIIGGGIVHSIDIEKKTGELVDSHPRIKLFTKGWQNYDIEEARGFSKILIIEDGSHMYEDTIGALKKFSPLVTIGSYFIVEDGIVDELGLKRKFHGGPLRGIKEFLVKNDNYQVDRTFCDFFGKNATFNVDGYLKRVK